MSRSEFGRRVYAIARIWYRHDVRRWWRRHVTTRRMPRAWRPITGSANSAYLQIGYNTQPLGLANALQPSIKLGELYKQYRADMNMQMRRNAMELAFADAERRRVLQAADEAIHLIAGIHPFALGRPTDEG